MTPPGTPPGTANWVPLEGATNVRDVGGWSTPANESVRKAALYRSDRLNNLTEDDQAELADRGIRTVIDFRAIAEIERDPSRLWHGVINVISLPIEERPYPASQASGTQPMAQPMALLERILSHQITAISEAEMAEVYKNLLSDNAAQFANFVTLVADTDNWPLLYHCTAGKDRTGLATALVHELCGVDRSQVLDEYCVTNEQRSNKRLAELAETFEQANIDVEAIKPLLTAPRAVLAAALTHLDENYAGVEGFLLNQGEMDSAVPAQLRLNLLI